MKKLLFFLIPALILAVILIFSYQFFFIKKNIKGALQVTSNPQSKIYVDGRLIGQTPLCKCEAADMLPVGSYTLRLVPLESALSEYQEKIEIAPSVLTVVDRKFGKGATSDGSVIFLTKLPEKIESSLLVLSLPDKADVFMDNASLGQTPILLSDLTESDHALRVKKNGYKDKVVRIRTPKGYKLTARIYIGIDETIKEITASPSAALSLTPSKKNETVVILQTPNGFLRVREDASLNAVEIGRVSPGETFEVVDEKSGWYQIKLEGGQEGWISSQFAKKQE